jgi:hypothetical protein
MVDMGDLDGDGYRDLGFPVTSIKKHVRLSVMSLANLPPEHRPK